MRGIMFSYRKEMVLKKENFHTKQWIKTKDERRINMFNLDLKKIYESDVFLFVLDGRVPDEGACVELGLAYSHRELTLKYKRLIGFQTDIRAAFIGAKLNPMIKVSLDYITDNEKDLIKCLKSASKTQ